MSKQAWTKGPWMYGQASNYHGFYIAPASHPIPTHAAVTDDHIRTFNYPGDTEANARLIAAAPELEEALRLLLQQVDEHAAAGEVMPARTVDTDRARAALAKAEGRS